MMPRSSFRSYISNFCACACLIEFLLKSNPLRASIVSCATAVMENNAINANSRKAFIGSPNLSTDYTDYFSNLRNLWISLSSSKNIPNLVNQPFVLEILVLHFRQLFQQSFLFARQCGRCHYRHGHEQIATPAATKNRHSFSSEPKHCARLCAHRNLQLLFFVERLNHNLGTQRGLRKRDRHGLVKVITLSLKLLMFGYVDNNVEVTGRAPLRPRFPFTCNA